MFMYFSRTLGRLPTSSFIALSLQVWETPRLPPPEGSLKCNLNFNILFLSKILENCTSAAVTPQWECQFQSISERALETFPSPKTALPAVYCLLESHSHLSSVSWSLRLLHCSSSGALLWTPPVEHSSCGLLQSTGGLASLFWLLGHLCRSVTAPEGFWLSAFSVLFLHKGMYVWAYRPCSYLNIYSSTPCCLIALNMLLLGCCFQLLHFLVSVPCSCSSVIPPHTDIATSVTESGLGSLSAETLQRSDRNYSWASTQDIVILSPCKYSLWSYIITHSILRKDVNVFSSIYQLSLKISHWGTAN